MLCFKMAETTKTLNVLWYGKRCSELYSIDVLLEVLIAEMPNLT
jgi:hypothetical protein